MFSKLFRRKPQLALSQTPLPANGLAPVDAATPDPAALAPGDNGEPGAEAMARERLRAFAFAAADILVETTINGSISFATGAVQARFGHAPRDLIGRNITTLIAPSDQPRFAAALAIAPVRARIPPVVLHLGDAGRTAAAVSAMLVRGPPPRLCFSIGPIPIAPAEPALHADGAQEPADFAREADALLLAGGNGHLGLVEVIGWSAVKEQLPASEQLRLRNGIGSLVGEAAPGARTSELAEGRYGVLATDELAMDRLVRQIEQLLRGSPAGRLASVAGTEIPLDQGAMPAGTASRVLRYAVSRFVNGGAEAVTAMGAAGGLAGVLAQAELRSKAVHAAIVARRFHLAYQPVVHLHDSSVHHYEALVRPIRAAGLNAQTIQEFVVFAEAVGLSEVLDYAVLEQALIALRSSPQASVAVNMSGLSLQSAAFRDRVLPLLVAEHGVFSSAKGTGEPRSRLLIELTETAEIEDLATATATITQLRELGVPVCLDDFGAGAAAFRYLQEFSVDYVKIDGSFVRAATNGPRERSLVATMVELATSVGAATVAEMIETEEQAALMRELGVQFGQGWLFGRPGRLPGARQ